MVYITGDKHSSYRNVYSFCEKHRTTIDDILIVLGDAGINFSLNYRDEWIKEELSELPITLFCIQGNHDKRPDDLDGYVEKKFHGGTVFVEEQYPNLIFAKDGEIYDFEYYKCLVVGGAYSVDKDYRLYMGYPWFEDEQPSEETKCRILNKLNKTQIDLVFTHTCPRKYEPVEMFLDGVDQSTVDKSTEDFLNIVEEQLDYVKWFCGHWHTDKEVDNIIFMFHKIEKLVDLV